MGLFCQDQGENSSGFSIGNKPRKGNQMYECKIVLNAEFWTMVASLIAAGALVASVLSIKASREIDKNNAARVRDRERRDAIPLALAIQSEIQRAVGFGEGIEELVATMPAEKAADLCKELRADRERVLTSILRDNVNKLGCMDAETGKAAAGALTMSDIMYRQLRMSDELIEGRAMDLLRSLISIAQRTRPAYERADAALTKYTAIPSLDAAKAAQAERNQVPFR